ncbi:MAG TPA: SDR family NAD(P)-dependent oxidoreductase [Candidatus Binatia bacterium]|nr:SDR family NAD(P)-dependent oxidoreductase [Candidatus Binatia bacterium]
MTLQGKVAVVTGGGSGIGRAIALRLARDGAEVAVLDLRDDAAERVADEVRACGRRAAAVAVDVADAASVAAAADRVHAALGGAAIVVNSAGIAGFEPFAAMSEASFDRMIAVHLKGTFLVCRAFVADLTSARWGRIVNVSSAAGLTGGGPGLAHYSAAKAGIVGFTKALALELGPSGVTANAIAPGLIDTPLIRGAGAPPSLYDEIVKRLPARRIGQPEDIAAACAYLVSPEASFVTGQVLSPNGGGNT